MESDQKSDFSAYKRHSSLFDNDNITHLFPLHFINILGAGWPQEGHILSPVQTSYEIQVGRVRNSSVHH